MPFSDHTGSVTQRAEQIRRLPEPASDPDVYFKVSQRLAEGNSQPPACVHGNDCSLPEEDGKGRIYQPRDG